ncbi:MAG: cupredoxin domain-containing protein [Candidatus Woesearchaeota archaeon]|nr:cupredoxin domain-containing protein [Candidatus Woesearchaeota archaeon]
MAKLFLLLFFCIMVLLAGCSTLPESNTVPTGAVKEFTITAQNWEFSPATIRVNEGDTVVIHARTIEGIHGLLFPDFNINKRLDPGEEVTIEFVADKKGIFPFACSVYCGNGHTAMNGILIVE